ncbi:hypothetical protein Tco_0897698 [Tanacetum coccineum]
MRNLKNDRILSTSKSSFLSNNFEKVEEYHKNLLLFKTPNHRPSEGNNRTEDWVWGGVGVVDEDFCGMRGGWWCGGGLVYETLEAEYVSLPTICSLIYLAMYVDYIAGQLLDILRNAPAAPAN